MDRYTKAFVVASLLYLVAGSALGIWIGAGSAADWSWFAHIHLNLLGFMAMMIYGVGYFILPRFSARPLVWPGGVAVHFYLSNMGLLGMIATSSGRPSPPFLLFSFTTLLSIALFAANLGATVLIPLKKDGEDRREDTPARVTPDTRIGEIISRWPSTIEVFVRNGFAPLADPAHREKVTGLPVTLAMGCANHGVDLGKMLTLLNEALSGSAAGPPGSGTHDQAGPIGPEDVIGDVLRKHPEAGDIFRRHYGEACFSCPGQATETIRQSALMHNADEGQLLLELNAAARREP